MKKPLPIIRSRIAVVLNSITSKTHHMGRLRLLFTSILLLGLLFGANQRSAAQVYYITNAGDGVTLSANDALNRINGDGSGNTVIAPSVAVNPALLAVDATHNRAFIYTFFTNSATNSIKVVNLTTGGLISTIAVAAAPGIVGMQYDPVGDYLYYTTSDANQNTLDATDALCRIKPDGTGNTVLIPSLSRTPQFISLDIGHNQVFVYEAAASDRSILTISLNSNSVTHSSAVGAVVGGMDYDATNNWIYFTTNDQNQNTTNATDALNRIHPDGSGSAVVAGSIAKTPSILTLDVAQNRAFVYEGASTNKSILSVNLTSGAVSQVSSALAGTIVIRALAVPASIQLSNNADLNNLTLSTGTLNPAFASGTTGYTASVPNATTAITVTPTTAEANSTVKVNGVTVASGSASGSIALNVGTNTITTVVTAPDGTTTKTYTVTVTRVASANADLTNLVISQGTLTPAFATGTTSYTASVGNAVTSLTLTPTISAAGAIVTVNGTAVTSGTASGAISLNVGANTITSVVTAPDGTTTKTYTVTVTRVASANADLTNLVISQGTLTPAFATGTTSYTASVGNAITSLTLTPTISAAGAIVTVNGTAVTSGTASGAISLNVGANTITSVVTAPDGTTTKTYTVTVTRAGATDANLGNLTISDGTLTPAFATGTTSYTASVGNAVTAITLTPTTSDVNATVTVNGTAVTSGTASGAIALNVGANTITTIVTAQDGSTTNTYTVTITRSGAANANLNNLTISAGTLTPAFATGTTSYTVSVGSGVASITLTPTASDVNASITVNGTIVSSGAASGAITLNTGANIITTIVTAQDGTTINTYTVTVTRAVANNAPLYYLTNAGDGVPLSAADALNRINQDGTNNTVLAASVAVNPSLMALDQANNRVFIYTFFNNSPTNAIKVVNLTTGALINTISVPASPGIFSMRYDPAGDYLYYITNDQNQNTQVPTDALCRMKADGTGNTVLIPSICKTPSFLSLDVAHDQVFVYEAASTARSILTVSLITNAITHTLPISTFVGGMDYDATNNWLYFTTNDQNQNTQVAADAINRVRPDGSGLTVVAPAVVKTPTFITIDPVRDLAFIYEAASSNKSVQSVNLTTGVVNQLTTALTGTIAVRAINVPVTAPLSPNARLSNIVLSTGTLNPVFVPTTNTYTASVASAVTSITLTPTVINAGATVKVNGTTVASGTASGAIALNVGPNTITTVVTAQDGTTTNTYTVTVTRAGSVNANLTNLTLSAGTLTPAFATGTTSYTASVTNATANITVTPTTSDAGATVKVNGTTVVSGSPSANIPLLVGPNTITTVVTAQDGTTTKTYTVAVTRSGSANADLSNVTLSAGTLTPVFAAGTTSYTASVTNSITSVTLTPTVSDANSTVTVNGTAVASGTASGAITLNVGPNTITTIVTAQNGTTTKTYTVTVTRVPASVATLSNLVLSSGTLTPVFASGTTSYTASVSNATANITVTPTTTAGTATVTVNGTAVASGTASANLPLVVGPNTITTVITAQDGTTTDTYTVVVTRAASANADLANLVLSNGTLTPVFASGTTSYTANVANAITNITLTPTTGVNTSTVTVNGTAVISGAASGAIALNVGPNTITTVVTAEDGTTTKTYTVIVTRAPASIATLSNLVLSNGTLTPVFASGTASYTASVGNSVTNITLTPTTTSGTATVMVNGTAVTSGTASGAIALNVGTNTITTVVTAQDGTTTSTYTLSVTRAPASIATLSNLVLSNGTLTPVFTSGTTSYTASVTNATTSITLTPTTSDVNATVKVNGVTVASGTSSGAIALNVGPNTITTVVTAQDGTTTNTYTVTVTRAASAIATLANLTLSSGTLNPVFASSILNYTASVSNAITSITLTPTTSVNTATIKVNGITVASGTASGTIALNVGPNTITTVVTAQNGTTTNTYTVTVTRAPSANADLANLAISNGTLNPVFVSGTINYVANVGNAVTSITTTPTTSDAGATIKVNGITVTSGTASGAIALNVGANTITTVVTAQDGSTIKTYTVTIIRAAASTATLSNLVTSSGTLTPVFASGTTIYTASVSNATTSITITPTASDVNSTIKVNGVAVASGTASGAIPLSVGPNTITTIVTAQDGITTGTYVVTVTRAASTNTNLANLTISSGTLTPVFASGTITYTANVANAIISITTTPTTADANATVKVNGVTVVSGTASGAIALNVGPNTITTVVTAQDGSTTKTYTVTVTRAPSSVATLSTLALSSGTLTPVFASGTVNYTASVGNATTSITVTPTTSDVNSSVQVNGVTVASGTASGAITLNVGPNTITTVVTAQDGTTTNTYSVTVTRAPASVATLSNLVLSSGTLTPVFASGITSYTASVSNSTTSITVTPTTSDINSTVKINGVTVVSGSASASIPLAVGANVIATIVTAQDGITTNTYTVTVTRATSTNADLVNLTLSNGTMTPAFASGTTSYTASVSNGITGMSLTPTTSVNTATVKVNGTTVASGTASANVPLLVGPNTITTVVTAQDGITTKTYTVVVTRAASSVATLSNLTISNGILTPVFASGTTAYTANVNNATTGITLTPTTSVNTATIKVNGVTVASGSTSASIPLAVGPNTITTIVTAQDGVTVKTYTVTITRAASTNANLANLTLSNGLLTPPFISLITLYATAVPNAVTSITLTPTASNVNATIKVNGTTVASGTASAAIPLAVGSNTITTMVTAQDGITTKTYTVVVIRAAASIATLSNLTISSGTLTPAFASGTNIYTTSVSNSVSSITLTPTTSVNTATVRVNGVLVTSGTASANIPLFVGPNIITTIVTAQDGITTGVYIVTVTRAPASTSTLSNLAISSGTLIPVFASGTTNYTASVGNAIINVTLTPTVNDVNSTVKVNGVTVASGTASAAIPLNVGPNVINTVVTAQDGITTKTYTVKVTRAPSSTATLNNLAISSGTLTPVFASGTTSYTASVGNATTSVTITPTVSDINSTIKVNGAVVASGTASASIPLNVGPNVISTVVTAQDGITTKTYTVTVTRAPSSTATLSNLAISSGTLTPVFATGTTSYTANVTNATTSIAITPTTTVNTAMVKVNGTTVASGTASANIPLLVGPNVITTVVTAQDGITTGTYTITVIRAASANANLANITLSSGILTPVFVGSTISYTASVSNAINSITLTPTTSVNTAIVKVNGTTVASGSASTTIALVVGPNTITTVVTAQDGITTKTYTVTIIRAPSSIATLGDLALSSGTLTPVFVSGTISYAASVANAITNITLTPTTSVNTATVKVNGTTVASGTASANIPLLVGPNVITTVVTAQDGITTKTYTVTVTRIASANANLANLSISVGSLTPAFVSATTSYTASVTNATTSIILTPTISDATATIKVNGVTVASGIASGAIALNVGTNIINTVVTAQNGSTTKTYTVVVTRAASTNAGLANLTLSSGVLTPVFATGTTSYASSVPYVTNSITLTPTTADAAATIKVNGIAVTSGAASVAIPLSVGANTITAVVTAQDGVTKTTYTVTVTRDKAIQTITFNALNDVIYGSADVDPGGTVNSGLPISYTSSDNTVATIVNGKIHIIGAGSTTITASQAGNATYSPAVGVSQLLTVNPAPLTIMANPQTRIYRAPNPPFTVRYVGFVNGDGPGNLTKLPIITTDALIDSPVGTYAIAAQKAASPNYTISYTLAVFTITPASRTLTFNPLPGKTYGDANFNAGASSSSDETIIYSGYNTAVITITNGVIHIVGAGTTTITATVPANSNYLSTPTATQTLTVNKAQQTISNINIPVLLKGGQFDLSTIKASSGLPLTLKVIDPAVSSIQGLTLTALRLGTTTLIASQPGNNNYFAAGDASGIITVKDAAGNEVLVHQAVSPNGDGINDILLIEGIKDYLDNRLTIVNRNGVKVYETRGYGNGNRQFDGHSNITGAVQQAGTYFYELEYSANGVTKHKTGYFVLKYN
jgi:gliding motility-associated-like protein